MACTNRNLSTHERTEADMNDAGLACTGRASSSRLMKRHHRRMKTRGRWLATVMVAAMMFGLGGAAAADDAPRVISPYEDVDLDRVNQYSFIHHVHARGEPYEEKLEWYANRFDALQIDDRTKRKTPIWPWQEHDIDPESLSVYNVPGSESFGGATHFVWLWSFYQHTGRDYHDAFRSAEDHALAYLAHPNRGSRGDHPEVPDGEPVRTTFEWLEEYFEEHDKLRGLGVLNLTGDAYDVYDFELWHELLLRFGPQRPVWGYGSSDARGTTRAVRYDRVLSETIPDVHPDSEYEDADHASEFKDAWAEGRTFWVNHRGAAEPPTVTAIQIEDGTITLDVEGAYDQVRWMYGTEHVSSGNSFDFADTDAAAYVYIRFEIWTGDPDDASNANIVGSQPFYFEW